MIRSQNVNYITDNQEIILFLNDIMQQDQSIFVGRMCGSDCDVVKEYYNNTELFNDDAWYEHSVYRVKRFNGYFDFTNSKDNFKRYLETMINAYKNTDYVSYGSQDLILEIEKRIFNNIKVNYDTMRTGEINKSVTITSNAINEPNKVIRIKGEVGPAPESGTPVNNAGAPINN